MANIEEEIEDNFEDSFVDEPSDGEQDVPDLPEEESNPVAKLLKQLQSSGALVQKSIKKDRCVTCDIVFEDKDDFFEHLTGHVTLPYIVVSRVDADSDDFEEDEDDWSSDGDKLPSELSFKPINLLADRNITIGKFLETGRGTEINPSLTKTTIDRNAEILSRIGGICIKKISTNSEPPQNKEIENKPDTLFPDNLKNMETTGTLKLTIKHSSDNKQFQVVNGGQPVKAENVTTASTEKNESEVVDSKQGILENYLNVPIKTEPDSTNNNSTDGQAIRIPGPIVVVKSEAQLSPPIAAELSDASMNHLKVKSFANQQETPPAKQVTVPKPMLIPKVEKETCTVIEINCDDSDKDDDEIIFVDSSPGPDKKPVVALPPPNSTANQPYSKDLKAVPLNTASSSSSNSNTNVATEKQHSFDWNAPSSKTDSVLESMLSDKNTDDLFASLLSSHRKDGNSDLESSEYISLDKLGSQHTCDVCNTRYTSTEMLENHRKSTGHSNQLVPTMISPSGGSMAISTYQQPGFLNMNSILPVKQLADTVSKIASGNSTGQFTHQQNIMVNIQSFPGGMGQHGMVSQQPTTHPSTYSYPGMQPPYQPGYRMPNQNNPSYPGPYPPPPAYSNAYPQYTPPGQHLQQQQQQQQQQPVYNQMNAPYPPHTMSQNYAPNQFMIPQAAVFPPTSMGQPMPSNQPIMQNNQISNRKSPANQPIMGQNVIPLGNSVEQPHNQNGPQNTTEPAKTVTGGIKIQSIQPGNGTASKLTGPRMIGRGEIRGQMAVRPVRGRGGMQRPGVPSMIKPGVKVNPIQPLRGPRPGMVRSLLKRPAPSNGPLASPSKKRMEMLLPDRHDNEDCQVVSMQHQREGLPLIQSIQGSRDKTPAGVQLSSQITVTKTKVNPPPPLPASKDASAVANMLAARGIKITPKQKPNIPNLGGNISITPTKSSLLNFTLPEDNDIQCSLCSKSFANNNALNVHMRQFHSSSKNFSCEHCFISCSTAYQLLEHKKNNHSVPNAEMGLPVLDISQTGTLKRLYNLGITNFIPLGSKDQDGNVFAIPIISIQNALNGKLTTCLQNLGVEGLLSLGPVKQLPKC